MRFVVKYIIGKYVTSGRGKMDSSTVKNVSEALRARGLTMACAESCTGGLVAKLVTDLAGSSEVFEGGVVSYSNDVKTQADKSGIADDAVSIVIPGATLYIPFAELVDIEKEKERLNKEKARLEGEIKRSNGMLSNERFISKAPAEKVAEEKAKLEKYTQMLAQVEERLATL